MPRDTILSKTLKRFCVNTNDLPKLYSSEDKETIDYLKSLFEDKLKLYHYCEYQLNRIAFANSIFIAALAVLIDGNNDINLNIWTVMLFLPFIVSLSITLWSAIPKFFMPWKKEYKGTTVDHRSIYGIKNFKGIEEYKEYISALTPQKTYDEIITQIYKMNDTIIYDYKKITVAVICGLIGLLGFICYLLTMESVQINILIQIERIRDFFCGPNLTIILCEGANL